MSATLALPSTYATVNAMLRERVSSVERSLVETRTYVINVLDRELSSVRGCLATIETLVSVPGKAAQAPGGTEIEQVFKNPPQYHSPHAQTASPGFSAAGKGVHEAELDPRLVQATVDELNAALAAAFSQVSDL